MMKMWRIMDKSYCIESGVIRDAATHWQRCSLLPEPFFGTGRKIVNVLPIMHWLNRLKEQE